jgi:hypothetical protein
VFEQKSTTKRAFFNTDATRDEEFTRAMAWLHERAEETGDACVIVIVCAGKANIENLTGVLGAANVKRLVSGQSLMMGTRAVVLRLLSRGVSRDIRANAVLALWLNDKDLAVVDDERPSSICLMPWVLDHSRRWIESWSPIDLISGQPLQGVGTIDDPVVLGALKSLTNSVNLAHSILGTTDRDEVVETIKALRKAGHNLDPACIRAWAVTNGWGAEIADVLREIVQKINDGKALRTRVKHSYDRRAFEYWRELGSRSDS